MAHAIFVFESRRRGQRINVLSAGILAGFEGMLAAREARLTCDRRGTPMPKFVATHIANLDLSGVRRVFVMERGHISALVADITVPPERMSLLGEFDPQQRGSEIDDPMGQDEIAFERCYERLRDCIIHYLDTTKDF